MTLVVEDGTGLALADAYASLDDVTNFQIGRADYATWIAADIEQQEAAIRESTVFLDGEHVWRGWLMHSTQALSWPRSDVYDDQGRLRPSNVVPPAVVQACAFLAAKAITSNLQPETAGAGVKSKSVGPSGVSITYGSDGATPKRSWPEVTTMLRGLTTSGPGGLGGTIVRWS
jgi:Putative DnaT-like ssDNA binding protein